MNKPFPKLSPNAQRGSKPRCHLLTEGPRAQVAERLTALIAPWGSVASCDQWMPQGFVECDEAQLHAATELFADPAACGDVGRWWLPHDRLDARTPNWDIASTCTVGGRKGFLLIEAKAHDQELLKEAAGRRLESREPGDKNARAASHATIGRAIAEARDGLCAATGLPWNISRDSHYQLSNRFAWSWKLASLGFPVILVYLGFLGAGEMDDQGKQFASADGWERLVRSEGAAAAPDGIWNRESSVGGVPFVPLIRSVEQPLDCAFPIRV